MDDVVCNAQMCAILARINELTNEQFDSNVPVMYNVTDIQNIFGIGRTKAYQLMASSGFPAIRLNKKVVVYKDKLEEWIRKTSGKTFTY